MPTVRFAEGVTGIPDVVYANLPGYRPLLLDLYLPSSTDKPVPLVLFIHGGSMRAGTSRYALGIDDFPAALASLAARGYAVASVNYRLSGEARFPAQVQDVKAAIRFLRANAAKYNIDIAHALVWGSSSGGLLAALVAESCGKPDFAPPAANSAISDCVQGAVIWYGDLDLSDQAAEPSIRAFLGCDPCDAAKLAAANPITFISPATPPMLLVNGATDTAVPLRVPQAMAERLQKAKVPVESYVIPAAGHGFIGKTQQITREANQKALEWTFNYIDKLFSRRPPSDGSTLR